MTNIFLPLRACEHFTDECCLGTTLRAKSAERQRHARLETQHRHGAAFSNHPLTLSLLCALVLLAACAPAEDSLKIGFIGPLTGDASQWGIPPLEGAQLAAAGSGIVLVPEDDQCDPQQAVTAARKLITIDNVDAIIGAVCSSATLAIAPLAEEHGVVLVSPASTSPDVSDAGDFVFRVVPSDALRGQVFARYLSGIGVKSVSLLYTNNEGGKGGKDAFAESFAELGGTIVSSQAYEQGSADLRTELLKAGHPGAIVIVSHPQETITILRQAKELGIAVPLYFQTEAMDDPGVISTAGDAAEGATYILAAEPDNDTFKGLFLGTYGKEPSLYAAEGYDALALLRRAAESCRESADKSTCMKEKLYKVAGYDGASGTITIDGKGDVVKPMAIKRIENGKKETIAIV